MRSKQIESTAIAATVAAAFLYRLFLGLSRPRTLGWDEAEYLHLGRHLLFNYSLGNPHAQIFYPPLNPAILGMFSHFFSNPERPGELSNALFGALLLLPVYVIVRRMYGSGSALVAAALLAIFPPLSIGVLQWGTMTEPPYLFFVWVGLASLFVCLERPRPWLFAAAGLMFGLAYLTRPEGILYFVVFFAFVFVWSLARLRGEMREHPERRRYAPSRRLFFLAAPLLLFAVAFSVAAAPYIYFLHVHTGRWMASAKSAFIFDWQQTGNPLQDARAMDKFALRLNPRTGESVFSEKGAFRGEGHLLDLVLAHPRALIRRVLHNTRLVDWVIFGKDAFWFGLLPLTALGLFGSPWDRRRLLREAFLLASILPVAALLILYVKLRFLTPLLVVLLIWTANGVSELGNWIVQTVNSCWEGLRSPSALRVAARSLPFVLVCGFFLAVTLKAHPIAFNGEKQAGLWIRNHSAASARVMDLTEIGPVYADRADVGCPSAGWHSLLRFALARHVTYWVTNDWQLTKLRPRLAFLLKQPPPDVKLVFSYHGVRFRTLVYQLSDKRQTARTESEPETEVRQ